jgi:hypothetical protein
MFDEIELPQVKAGSTARFDNDNEEVEHAEDAEEETKNEAVEMM